MKKKDIGTVILCLFCIFGFAACGNTDAGNQKTDQGGTETTIWNNGNSLITGESKQLTEPPVAWKISEETKLKSEKIGYDPKTDGNWRMASDQCCETENGNIYKIVNKLTQGNFLYCYDAETHGYRALCNRPECYHAGTDCDAFLAEEAFGLEYYNGKLYTVLIERNEQWDKSASEASFSATVYANLYAINPDGTGRIKVQTLKTVEKRNDLYNVSRINIDFIIHRGYVYYKHNLGHPLERDDYYRNGKNCIFRVPLGSSETEAECVYVLPKLQDAEGVYDQRNIWMKPYGTYVYFLESVFNPENPEKGLISVLRRIDTSAKQVEKIPLETEPDLYFYVTGEGIYYNNINTDGELRIHHLETGKEEIVADFTPLSQYKALGSSYDGTYWYVFCDTEQEVLTTDFVVLDSDFQKIGELDLGFHALLTEETEHQIVFFTEDNKLYGWLDKADIAKGNLTVHRAEQTE